MPETSRRECGSATAVKPRQKTMVRQNEPWQKKPIKNSTEAVSGPLDTQKFYRQLGFYRRRFQELIQELDTLLEKIGNDCESPRSHSGGHKAVIPPQCDLREDQIKAMAYFIWESEGCPANCDKKHWSMAIERLQRARQDGVGA